MSKMANVVRLNNDDKNVYGTIHTFLMRKGQDSKNTRITYERHIRDFFRAMRNKEIENLSEDDLIFTHQQIESYQVSLKERYKGSTVNNTMSALRECYVRLERNFDVRVSWFDVDRYSEYDKESWDTLSHDEVCAIIDLVSKTRAGKQKGLLVRLAYATAYRKASLLTAKWNQIVNVDDTWYMKVLGKGNKWSHKRLSDDLLATLMKFKEDNDKSDDDKIFTLTDKTVNRMMNYIREHIDFGDRNIVFHSFKNASLNEVNQLTGGDLKAIQAQGDHSDAQTSLNFYISNKKMDDLVVVDVKTELPIDKFDEMTHAELLDLVKNTDRATMVKLLRQSGAM